MALEFKGPTNHFEAIELCLEDPENFKRLPPNLITRLLVERVLRTHASIFPLIPDDLIDGRLADLAVSLKPSNYKYIPLRYCTSVMLHDVLEFSSILSDSDPVADFAERLAPPDMTKDLLKECLKADGRYIRYAPQHLIDEDVLIYLVENVSDFRLEDLYAVIDKTGIMNQEFAKDLFSYGTHFITLIPHEFQTEEMAAKVLDDEPQEYLNLDERLWTCEGVIRFFNDTARATFVSDETYEKILNALPYDEVAAKIIIKDPAFLEECSHNILTPGVLKCIFKALPSDDLMLELASSILDKPELLTIALRCNLALICDYDIDVNDLRNFLLDDEAASVLRSILRSNHDGQGANSSLPRLHIVKKLVDNLLEPDSADDRREYENAIFLIDAIPAAFEFVSSKAIKECVALTAIQGDGLNLQYLTYDEITLDLALAAVKQNPEALQYILDKDMFDKIVEQLGPRDVIIDEPGT